MARRGTDQTRFVAASARSTADSLLARERERLAPLAKVGAGIPPHASVRQAGATARRTKRPSCTHPPVARECHNGYDITCGDCEALVGRVARLDGECVLNREEACELLGMIGDAGEGSSVRAKLERTMR